LVWCNAAVLYPVGLDPKWDWEDREPQPRFLIRDRDSRFMEIFYAVFCPESMKIILAPARAPNANSHAGRWVRSLRPGRLNKIIIVNQTHRRSVLTEYVEFYNTRRPHQRIWSAITDNQVARKA
jgi:transposase InsO family protein